MLIRSYYVFENNKNKSNWALQIGELRLDVVKASRPKLSMSLLDSDNLVTFDDLVITIVDNVEPSTSHIIMDWLKEQILDLDPGHNKVITLVMTDDNNIIVEKWEYENVKIKYIDFGDLSIYDNNQATITLSLLYDEVILHNNDK